LIIQIWPGNVVAHRPIAKFWPACREYHQDCAVKTQMVALVIFERFGTFVWAYKD